MKKGLAVCEDEVCVLDNGNTEFGLAGRVYSELVQLILKGEFQPHQPLRIQSVAKQLGVSATPVREALVRASAVGLVLRETNKGFRVAPRPDAAQLDELFDARITIETRTAQLAAERVDALFIEGLEETFTRQLELGKEDTFDAFTGFLAADSEFHRLIAAQSQNRFLANSLSQLGSHEQRYRSFENGKVTDRSETLAEHRAIIEAMRNENPTSASAAMIVHLSNLRQRVHNERLSASEAEGSE